MKKNLFIIVSIVILISGCSTITPPHLFIPKTQPKAVKIFLLLRLRKLEVILIQKYKKKQYQKYKDHSMNLLKFLFLIYLSCFFLEFYSK